MLFFFSLHSFLTSNPTCDLNLNSAKAKNSVVLVADDVNSAKTKNSLLLVADDVNSAKTKNNVVLVADDVNSAQAKTSVVLVADDVNSAQAKNSVVLVADDESSALFEEGAENRRRTLLNAGRDSHCLFSTNVRVWQCFQS